LPIFPTVREAIAALTTAMIEKPTVRVPVSVTRNGPHVERHVMVTADGEVIELWRSARNRPHPSSAWWTVPWVTDCPRCHCDLYANHPSGTDE